MHKKDPKENDCGVAAWGHDSLTIAELPPEDMIPKKMIAELPLEDMIP